MPSRPRSEWLRRQGLLACCLLSISAVRAQQSLGFTGGLSLTAGWPVNRAGLTGAVYYVRDFVQVSVSARGCWVLRGLGPRPFPAGPEFQVQAGVLGGFGPRRFDAHPFHTAIANQTGRQYAAAYAFSWYIDRFSTTQRSGTLAVHIGRLQLATENDALGGGLDDRFRTGAFGIQYRFDAWTLGLQSVLWTGDARGAGVKKVTDSAYPARFGYRDVSQVPYGRFSHGILSLQAQALMPWSQIGHASLGIDAEQVRHFLQNRLIHDMPFIPDRWIKAKNLHYPMLDRTGMPYLFLPGQQVRKPRPVVQAGLNGGLFY